MKVMIIAAATVGLLSVPALAESNMNKMTPSNEMQTDGAKAGASGHEMTSGRSESNGSGIKGEASGRASGAGGDQAGGTSGSMR